MHLKFSLVNVAEATLNTPAGVDGCFQSVKILSMTSFGKESRGSRVVDLRHVKEPQAEIRTSEQNL